MLALAPGSSCDVCAEEYSSHCLPHSIPCGHILCRSCSNTIIQKTPSRLAPACPFCREPFNTDDVRLIRLDLNSSGWSTPRRTPAPLESNLGDSASAAWNRRMEQASTTDGSSSRARVEARRFEDKVAQIASKKSSVEDVTALQKELKTWLGSGVKYEEKKSLQLSEALLRAILINNGSHTDASRVAKNIEANLKVKVENLEKDLHINQQQYTLKSQECESLRVELSRFKVPSTPVSSDRSLSPTPHYMRSASSSPIPPLPSTYNPPSPNTALRFNAMHSRSASMSSHLPSSRSTSTSSHLRSSTPAPTPSTRSYTPSSIARSQTPGPTHTSFRTTTPAPPSQTPTKSRRQSVSTAMPPIKISRSTSEEKAMAHQRWVPFTEPTDMQVFKSSASAQSRQ